MARWLIWWWLLSQQSERCERESACGAAGEPRDCRDLSKGQVVFVFLWGFTLCFTSGEVQFPDSVWRNGTPLVSCLYFSTLVSLHFDYSHELRLGSITASSRWIQASVLLFTSANPDFTTASVWNQKHLHVSSDYCFYPDVKSSQTPWGSHFIYP